MKTRHPKQKLNCENCGIKDGLEYYEHVWDGITLCEDCADLKVSCVSKKTVNWVLVHGDLYPPDLPITKKL